MSCSADKTLRLWDVSTTDTIRVLRGHNSVVVSSTYSKSCSLLVSAGVERHALLWDLRSNYPVRRLRRPGCTKFAHVVSVKEIPGSTQLAMADNKGNVLIYGLLRHLDDFTFRHDHKNLTWVCLCVRLCVFV